MPLLRSSAIDSSDPALTGRAKLCHAFGVGGHSSSGEGDGRRVGRVDEDVAGGDAGGEAAEMVVEGAGTGTGVGGFEAIVGFVIADGARRIPVFFGTAGTNFEEFVGAAGGDEDFVGDERSGSEDYFLVDGAEIEIERALLDGKRFVFGLAAGDEEIETVEKKEHG